MMTARSSLRLAVAQPVTVPYDVATNVGAHASIVAEAAADVVVFPELSLTGYHFDAESISPDDHRLSPLVEACGRSNTIVLAGAPVQGHDGRHIAVLRIDGNEATVAYHKMYLGSDESAHFVAGAGPAAIEVAGWRFGLAVCKDTGVPDHAAATATLGIDVYAAGVLEHAEDADVQAKRAHRIIADHNVWVAVAGFAGPTGEGFDESTGCSTIWRPDGSVAAAVGPEPGDFAVFELDPR